MPNFITKAILAALVVVSPVILPAGEANAACQCKSVFRQGYGMVWLCCDQNGMCAYYDSYTYNC